MKIVQFAKDHPYMTGAGVLVGGFVVILILTSGGGTSEEIGSPDMGYYPPDNSAAIAANAQLSQMQLSAQVAAKESDNALAKAQSENDTLFKIASKTADVQNNANIIMGDTTRTVALYQKETTLGVAQFDYFGKRDAANAAAATAMASFDRDKYIADKAADVAAISANSERDIAAIIANRDATVTGNTNATNLAIVQSNNNTALAISGGNNATQLSLAGMDYSFKNLELASKERIAAGEQATTAQKNVNDYMLAAFGQASNNVLALSRR